MNDRAARVAREAVEEWSQELVVRIYHGDKLAHYLANLLRAEYQRGAVDANRQPGPSDYEPEAVGFLIGPEKALQARRVLAALAGEEDGDE